MTDKKHTFIEKHQNNIFIFGENIYFRLDGKITVTPLRRITDGNGTFTAGYDKEKGHISLSHIDTDHPDNNPELDDKVRAYCERLGKAGDFSRIRSLTLNVAQTAKDNLQFRQAEVDGVKDAVDTVIAKCLEMQWVLGFEKPPCHTHFDPGLDYAKVTSENLFHGYPNRQYGTAGGRENHVLIAGSITPPEHFITIVREEFGHIVDRVLGEVIDDGQRKIKKHASFHILHRQLEQTVANDKGAVEKFKADGTDSALWDQFDWKKFRTFEVGLEPSNDAAAQRDCFIRSLEHLLNLDGYEGMELHHRCSEHMVKLHVLRQTLEDLTIGKKVNPTDYLNPDMETSPALQLLDKVLPNLSKAYREEWLPKVRQKLLTDLQLASPAEGEDPAGRPGRSWAKACADRGAWVR